MVPRDSEHSPRDGTERICPVGGRMTRHFPQKLVVRGSFPRINTASLNGGVPHKHRTSEPLGPHKHRTTQVVKEQVEDYK